MIDQWSFTCPFEGIVPHLYKDTAGLVTGGAGFMFPTLADARRLAWEPARDLELDWAHVAAAPAGHTATFYKPLTRARLSEQVMRAEFAARIATFERRITTSYFPAWRTLPEPARIALLDMAYNLGVVGLGKFQVLRAACNAHDWGNAAKQCDRRGIQPARNAATRQLFEKCALDAR
jgi:GH24 family phage-related lysozyme (muramidase)